MKIRVRNYIQSKVINCDCDEPEPTPDVETTHYKGKWIYNYYPDYDLHPETVEAEVEEIDFWIVGEGGVTINGNFYAYGTTLQALIDTPGQSDDNWKRY